MTDAIRRGQDTRRPLTVTHESTEGTGSKWRATFEPDPSDPLAYRLVRVDYWDTYSVTWESAHVRDHQVIPESTTELGRDWQHTWSNLLSGMLHIGLERMRNVQPSPD